MILVVVMSQHIFQRHVYILQKQSLVDEFQVMDLSEYDLEQPVSQSMKTREKKTAQLNLIHRPHHRRRLTKSTWSR